MLLGILVGKFAFLISFYIIYRYSVVAVTMPCWRNSHLALWTLLWRRCFWFYYLFIIFFCQFQKFNFKHGRWLILSVRWHERHYKHQDSKTKSKSTNLQSPVCKIVRKVILRWWFFFLLFIYHFNFFMTKAPII